MHKGWMFMVNGSALLSTRIQKQERNILEKATDPVKYIHIPDNPCKSSECMHGRGDITTYLLARWRPIGDKIPM